MNGWVLLLLLVLVVLIWRWLSSRPPAAPFRPAPPSPKIDWEPPSARKTGRRKPKSPREPRWKPLTPDDLARRKAQDKQDRLDRLEAQRLAEDEKRQQEARERDESFERVRIANEKEEERRRRQSARGMLDTKVGRQYQHYIAQPIPAQIRQSMRAFEAGQFVGADRSPLAYVGYHVGVTNGLPVRDRELRMLVCFRIDIPPDLMSDYRDWAGPASRQRLGRMRGHLRMLASQRRGRPGFDVAVSEWERDAEWLQTELGTLAETFDRQGVTW